MNKIRVFFIVLLSLINAAFSLHAMDVICSTSIDLEDDEDRVLEAMRAYVLENPKLDGAMEPRRKEILCDFARIKSMEFSLKDRIEHTKALLQALKIYLGDIGIYSSFRFGKLPEIMPIDHFINPLVQFLAYTRMGDYYIERPSTSLPVKKALFHLNFITQISETPHYFEEECAFMHAKSVQRKEQENNQQTLLYVQKIKDALKALILKIRRQQPVLVEDCERLRKLVLISDLEDKHEIILNILNLKKQIFAPHDDQMRLKLMAPWTGLIMKSKLGYKLIIEIPSDGYGTSYWEINPIFTRPLGYDKERQIELLINDKKYIPMFITCG